MLNTFGQGCTMARGTGYSLHQCILNGYIRKHHHLIQIKQSYISLIFVLSVVSNLHKIQVTPKLVYLRKNKFNYKIYHFNLPPVLTSSRVRALLLIPVETLKIITSNKIYIHYKKSYRK